MIIINLIKALLLTEIVEIAVSYLLGYRNKSFFLVLLLINLITNPLINFIIILLYSLNIFFFPYMTIMLLEAAVVIAEWRMLKNFAPKSSKSYLLLAIIINSVSYLTGVLIFR